MAAKKTAPKKSEAPAKKTAAKAPKAPAAKKAAEPAAAKTKPAAKPAAPKKAAVKLTDKQKDFLKKISDTGETGYVAAKAELRSAESLRDKKLLKRAKVDKASGAVTYLVTAVGKKHLTAPEAKG